MRSCNNDPKSWDILYDILDQIIHKNLNIKDLHRNDLKTKIMDWTNKQNFIHNTFM
jgi:hypothetical protein